MKRIKYIAILTLILISITAYSQEDEAKKNVIQFSGKVVTENNADKIAPLPYTNVSIKGTSRGSVSEFDGFFSIVAQTGDTIVFSQIGYKTVEYVIPDSLDQSLYYWIQIMTRDNVLLPEAVIRPYPSREFFKIDLLAMDVSDEIEQNLEKYLADEILQEIRYNLPVDGTEAVDLYLRQNVSNYRYEGQIKPQNIFNPMAWKQFIDAWKRGDFKSKKKKK